MPELPEVETIVRRLSEVLIGKTILGVEVLREKSFIGQTERLQSLVITDVSRRAKIIRIHLAENLNLLIHLKMTGQLIYKDPLQKRGGGHPTSAWVEDLPTSHTRVIMNLSNDATLYFNDMRVFGWLKVLGDDDVVRSYTQLGPDIIDSNLKAKYLFDKFQRRSVAVKQALMDNAVVCGVGNIYACDALNLAKLHPSRQASSLSFEETVRLLKSTQEVIHRGIDAGGATIDTYAQVDGFSGRYQDQILVYGREGDSCPNCQSTIFKTKIGGRGTYYCDSCQV